MLRSKKSLLFSFQFARNKLYLIFFILIYTDFPLKQKHSYLFFSFRILPISSKKKTRFLNKEPRSLQKSVFMMSKIKEEKKSLSTFTKFIRPPSILVSEFLLWKKEPMHLMKRTKKNQKNTQHLVKNIMLAVQNFLLSKQLHIASQSYS